MSEEIVETFEKLLEKISEVYDLRLSKEITEIFQKLVLRTMKVMRESERLEGRYWDLVKKLAKCEKGRDEERRASEQAEYDKEYFAKELAESR